MWVTFSDGLTKEHLRMEINIYQWKFLWLESSEYVMSDMVATGHKQLLDT